MTRLWRAATLILTATALVVGPASAVFATEGDSGGRDGRPTDSAPDRRGDREVDTTIDVVVAEPEVREVDAVRDRPADRPADRVTDRVRDRETDRVRDRVTDRPHRPECDPDRETDRVHDCEPKDEIRPILKRCINYVQNHTDLVIRRHLRWWYHVCHRIIWNHNHPQ